MKVVVVSGPTATGKTAVSIELARRFGGEVVNFDSLVLYDEITIGTAKPTPAEQGEIPHHMVGVVSISKPLNAADYAREALPIIDRLLAQKKLVFVVGGSGFYLQALLQGMYDSPTTRPEITKRSDELYASEGIGPFLAVLESCDPASFARYHENDHYRVRRAVEHFWNTGTPLSEKRTHKDDENARRKESNVHGWELLHVHLDVDKIEHAEIIKDRTDRMLASGLVAEVEGLLGRGFTGLEKPLQSIGYKEVLDLRAGVLPDLEACRERINISTRQLAKAQRTWFNRVSGKVVFHPLTDRAPIFAAVSEFINKN